MTYTPEDPPCATGTRPHEALILSDSIVGRTRVTRIGYDWGAHARSENLPADAHINWADIHGDLNTGTYYLIMSGMPVAIHGDWILNWHNWLSGVRAWADKAYFPYIAVTHERNARSAYLECKERRGAAHGDTQAEVDAFIDEKGY